MNDLTMKIPKQVWIIFDPLDGPHIFTSKKKAKIVLKKWQSEAEDQSDSVWDMEGPIGYTNDQPKEQG